MQDTSAALPVTIREIPLANGQHAGHLILNKPKALNALDLEMAELMLGALSAWQARDDVLFVVISGEGDKAFCAGGDIVSMYKAMAQTPAGIPEFVKTFFTVEYQLDYLIHTYAKPVMVWGAGIVMGGGMGLLAGASHRVVTETSRLAMPEITIGLYPDVGGSHFLARMDKGNGLFLGLTGASINATDACYVGLADHYCQTDSLATVLDTLATASLTPDTVSDELNNALLQVTINTSERKPGQIEPLQALITDACQGDSASQVAGRILNLDATDNRWLEKAQSTLSQGSPVTACLVFEQVRRGTEMTLAECFRMELGLSCRCAEFGEFKEGIRALLIDKDNQPAWTYQHIKDVPEDVMDYFFTSPWNDGHPLASLEIKS